MFGVLPQHRSSYAYTVTFNAVGDAVLKVSNVACAHSMAALLLSSVPVSSDNMSYGVRLALVHAQIVLKTILYFLLGVTLVKIKETGFQESCLEAVEYAQRQNKHADERY